MIFELLHHLNVAFAVIAGSLIDGEMVVSFECVWSYRIYIYGMAILTLPTFASLSVAVINSLNRCFHKRQLLARLPDRFILSCGRNSSDILRSYRFRHHVICCNNSNVTTRRRRGHGTYLLFIDWLIKIKLPPSLVHR